jgi:PAS domain S-box-containing protein
LPYGVNGVSAMPAAIGRGEKMRWPKLTENAESRLRVILLAVAVTASVALPYAIIQRSAEATGDASTWVVQSVGIKESVYELMYTMRDIENVVLALYVDVPLDDGKAQYQTDRERIEPLLDRLAESTRDNPAQQNRIGNLEGIIAGRSKLFDSAMQQIEAKNYDGADNTLSQARELFPFRATANEIISAENELYLERSAQSAAAQRSARWAAVGVLLAQLLLLGSVIFVSERQIQHRRRAESLAQQAVARSRAIVQTVREPIVVLDTSLHALMINTAFREFYGGIDDEHIGEPLYNLGGGAWVDAVLSQRLLDVAARDRELWDYELRQRGGDGVERVVLVNARRMNLPGLDGDEPAILLTVNDVTAGKRSEQQIHELNRELEGKVDQVSDINRELEAFSYSVSHDLRAPLRHIAGFADKLGSHLGESADEKAHHYLNVISDSARRMSILIEDLLLYSRLGRNALRLQPIDMQALAEEIGTMLTADAGERRIEWHIDGLPIVIADESMLRQVWQNLLGNAVKYTARRDLARIEVGVSSTSRDEIVFFVKDNGTGFDMDYAGKLFGVFQRLHKASDFPGTGIGLANVRRIIARHGGRCWAEAVPDQGATFHFSLPAKISAGTTSEGVA